MRIWFNHIISTNGQLIHSFDNAQSMYISTLTQILGELNYSKNDMRHEREL